MNYAQLLVTLLVIAVVAAQRSFLDVNSPKAIKAAQFALAELVKLSDSGVYQSLSLHAIAKADEEDGIFHYNTILELQLHSPYFKSEESVETFHMVVMEHKKDSVMSFAIDEFPVMDENAIEKFWINKVEMKRREREQAYRRLEIEALLVKNIEYKTKYEREDLETILVDLDENESYSENKVGNSKGKQTNYQVRVAKYQERYDLKLKEGGIVTIHDALESHLSKLKLLDLYLITVSGYQPEASTLSTSATLNSSGRTRTNPVELIRQQLTDQGHVLLPLFTDEIYYRAQLMLDTAMKELF